MSLITITDIKEVRSIGDNAVEGLAEMIVDAEEIDVRQFLGSAFYKDFVDNKSSDKYLKLLNGTEYTYGTDTIDFPGLKKAICHLALAKWYVERSARITRTGMVIKETDFSTPVSHGLLKEKVEQERSTAVYYLEETRKYLSENTTLYPLWYGSRPNRINKMKITPIG